ncbi:hypothetical protein C8N43_1374 [Litoreibacter ponti]|uniref:Uncharacterized protein n=1 Tax=Litoreibacter ponti TaxID=1510457 RepID=A0A2T6BKY8_9RHOB|nr:hypothetical protein [Litoreibacter ponti]PTX56712.1 hypothetical protein C8N43_1374 [Litoreibacter ponti]
MRYFLSMLVLFFLISGPSISQSLDVRGDFEILELAKRKSVEEVDPNLASIQLQELRNLELEIVARISSERRFGQRLSAAVSEQEDERFSARLSEFHASLCDAKNPARVLPGQLRNFRLVVSELDNKYSDERNFFPVQSLLSELRNFIFPRKSLFTRDSDGKKIVAKRGISEFGSVEEFDCQKVKPELLTLIERVTDFERKLQAVTTSRIQETEQTTKALEEALPPLREKIEASKEALTKARTRQDLSSNLYLLILVIGAFGVLSIMVIRLFPTVVALEWVSSGQVIQFVTVTILLSVIMSLGLSGILEQNTLGTLLGGIGGYVLSQGVGRAAAHRAQQEARQEVSHVETEYQQIYDAISAALPTSTISDEDSQKVAAFLAQAAQHKDAGNFGMAMSALKQAQALLER